MWRPRARWPEPSALACLAGALVLLLATLLTRWYGTGVLPAHAIGPQTSAVGAWSELRLARWLILACVAVSLVAASAPVRLIRRAAVAVGALTAVVLFVRILVAPPSPGSVEDVKVGAYVALLAAVGLTLGALGLARAEGAQQR